MTDRTTAATRVRETLLVGMSRPSSRVIPRLPPRIQLLVGGGRPVIVDGNTLDPAFQMMLAGQRAAGIHTMGVQGDPQLTRKRAREICGLFSGPLVDVETADLVADGPAGPIPVRHYRAPDADAALLVYFHGGGYVFGDLDTHDPLCRLLCRDAGVNVLAVDYRLAPEHKAPAAADDALAAYRWARAHAEQLGTTPDRVAVGGDSAGAGLAATICQHARATGEPAPLMQLLLYPYLAIDIPTRSRTLFTDGGLLTEADQVWFASQYVEGSGIALDDPRVSPLLADDVSGLPPALVVTAGFDPLRDQGRAYAAKLAAAGVDAQLLECGSMVHAFGSFPGLGGGVTAALERITAALRTRLR